MDKITQQRILGLHPELQAEVIALVNQANAQLTKHSEIRITQGLRTFEEQSALYNQGRTTAGNKVTNAKAGQSFHNYGLAFDFCLLIDDKEVSWDNTKDWDGDKIADWMEVVNIFRKAGWDWGGTWKFKDTPHLQKVYGYTWQQLLEKYNNKDFISGSYVRI